MTKLIQFGKISVLLISMFLIINTASFASRYMASDFGWKKVGQDSFLITLTIYKDCNGSSMGSAMIIFKNPATNGIFDTLTITPPTGVDITPVCNGNQSRCQSATSTFPYGIEKYVYQKIIYLSKAGSNCNIKMYFQDNYRNTGITTIPASQPFYTEASFNRCISPVDHAPTFTNPPIEIRCMGQDVTVNCGIIDNDKNSAGKLDSVVYSWGQPKSAENTPISYLGSYTYDKPVFFWGFPNTALPFPRGIHLDPQTGDIQYRSMKAEVTIMVLSVKEYRNGVLIGEVRREIQTIYITCTNNNPPAISTPNNVRSNSTCAGSPTTFNFLTSDPNANDTVTISWNNAIPGAKWTNSNGMAKHPTATLTWTPNDSNVSSLPYTFTVTAKDNACPVGASFTQSYQIIVKPKPRANIIVTDSGCGKFWFFAQRIEGVGPVYTWQSNMFTFSPQTGQLTSHTFLTGQYPYTMTMTASGCSNTFYDTVKVFSLIKNTMSADTQVCYGSTIKLTSKISNNAGTIKIKWGSGNKIFSSDTGLTKTLTVTHDTVIWSMASDKNCMSKDSIHISLYKPIGLNLDQKIAICGNKPANIEASCQISKNAIQSINWTNLKTNNVVGTSSVLSTADSGIYSCTVTDTFGCVSKDTIHLAEHPEILANAIGKIICYGEETILEADSTGGGNAVYYWYDSKYLGSSRKIKVKPTTSTNYTLWVMETIGGSTCQDTFKVRVSVTPLPVIRIYPIDKRCVIGSVINLNNFLTVNNQPTTSGVWSSPSAGLIYDDKFNPLAAGVSTPPGWKVRYDYTDPLTGCYNKDSSYVTVFALPKPYAGVDDSICTGSKIPLNGSPLLPPGTWRGTGVEGSYPNWKFNPDATGIVDGGTYNAIYRYKDNNQCENEDTVKFTVFKTPVTDAGYPRSFCENDGKISLSGYPSGGLWTGKGVAGNQFYPNVAKTGVHVLKYTVNNVICSASDTANYTVYQKPTKPVISLSASDFYLECDLLNGSYQWYYRPDFYSAPTKINSNSRRINPQLYCKKCYFNVIYTDSNGCVADTSGLYNYVTTSINSSLGTSGFIFYPNPAHSELFIENPNNETASLMLIDIFGKTVLEKRITSGKSSISTLTYKPGIYFIFIDGIIAGKLLIE